MAKINSLEDLLRHELSDLRNAEMQLTKALPKMAEAASDPALKEGFETHLRETEDQLQKVDRVFEMCGWEPERMTCEAMKGLIKEGENAIADFEQGPLLDVALIVAAQKVEHYEIAGYGSVCAIAKKLSMDEEEKILYEILEQERATDEKLNQAAESINEEAFEAYAEAAE